MDKDKTTSTNSVHTVIITNTSKPDEVVKDLDMENDPRYKELLDEEANKIDPAYLDRRWKDYSLVRYFGTRKAYQITLSAQRRYFSEKLAEKDKSFSDLLTEYEDLEKTIFGLTATIAERDKDIIREIDMRQLQMRAFKSLEGKLSKANATIKHQKKEIEQLKQEKISEYWRGWKEYGESL